MIRSAVESAGSVRPPELFLDGLHREKGKGFRVNFGYHPKIEFDRFVNQPFSCVSRFS